MPQNNEKLLEKLKKLLALAKSDNPHEAALALQRAQKLMQAYNITQADLALSDIDESVSNYWEQVALTRRDTCWVCWILSR